VKKRIVLKLQEDVGNYQKFQRILQDDVRFQVFLIRKMATDINLKHSRMIKSFIFLLTGNPETRQVSLADEISEAENRQKSNYYGTDMPNHSNSLLMIDRTNCCINYTPNSLTKHDNENSILSYSYRPNNFSLKFTSGARGKM